MKAVFVAAFAALLAFAAPAFAQEAKQDFKLLNKTGYELKALYVSPSKSDDWEDDVLGQDTLSDGQAVNVHFNPKVKTCTWDLKVTYSDDDSSAVWEKIDLCSVEKITIKYDRKNDKTSATFD
ncbi:MAG TPA: argininosuccinate lyase [Stellaceae bacterium]|nr:argininosuccinate lyase [Stellaceae bacterium]